MTTSTSIRLDKDFKKKLQLLAKEMGLSFSALVSASLRKTLEERKVEISAPLPESALSVEYEKDLMTDKDAKETVFVAKDKSDIDMFFNTL